MYAIYLKSADEKTIVKVSNPKQPPQLSEWYSEHGYTEIDQGEFKKIRVILKRKENQTHGYTNDEKELRDNLVYLASKHVSKSSHTICGRDVQITDMKNGKFVFETDRDESGYVTAENLNAAIYKIAEGFTTP